MSLPEFIKTVQFVANMVEPPADEAHCRGLADLWLTPAAVADFAERDFAALPTEQQTRLRDAVEQFRKAAEAAEAGATAQHIADARAALGTIHAVLKPHAEPDSEKARLAIWRAWDTERAWDWAPTFDYELRDNSTGDPAAWVWAILNDDVDIEADETGERLNRLQWRIRNELQRDGIERWPYTSVRLRSEVKELMARATA